MDLKLILQKEKEAFAADLDPKYILPSLTKNGVITEKECRTISSKTEKRARFNTLFSLLISGEKTFPQLKCFVDALEEEDEEGCLPYPWLAEKLKPALKLDDDVHKILVRGNLPVPVNHLLPRDKKIQDIRKKLIEASHPGNPTKWVVLHGPIGSGKSSLAAESLRVNYLIKDYFSDGVFWLDFGGHKVKSTKESEEKNCDEKIKNILKLLNYKDKYIPGDDLTHLLRKEVGLKKVLIILDEVCDESIIKRFDIECPILVTTTLINIMKHKSSHCSFIECPNDAQNSDLKLLLSKYANCKAEELPDVVQNICIKCGGCLLVASLIGGSMFRVGNDEETWKYWNKKLEEKGIAGLEKIDEGDVLNVIVNCIEHIKEWKHHFFYLVIFKKGFPISSQVLEMVWNKKGDQRPIFYIAAQLYQRSFVVLKESESKSKFFCCSHELYVDAVTKFLGKEKIKEMHRKFVDKMDHLSNGTFDLMKLPKDYIPDFIDYHLYEADKFKVLEKLYLDLKFVEQKIRLKNDHQSILMDYECYEKCFQNKEDVEKFKLFLERNGKYILTEEKCDLIQLALFEPHESIVYKKGKEYANKNKGFYYDCCNEVKNIHEFKIHSFSNIKFGAINQDASLVALIDGYKPEESEHKSWMIVWHIPTATEYLAINSHTDVINYCAFSSKGEYLVTASADTTVKIYQISVLLTESYNFMKKQTIKELVQETKLNDMFPPFTEHEYEVIYCSFSSEDRYVISSDVTGVTLVWKFNVLAEDSPYVISSKFTHNLGPKEPLIYSSFSNNDKTIGTAASDTLILWDVETEKKINKFSCKDKTIKKFIFTGDDSEILIMLDYAVLFWDVENDNQQIIFSDESCKISNCCLSTSGRYIACGMESGRIVFIIVETKEIKFLPGHNDEIVNISFSKDETKLFSISPTCYIIRNVSDIENTLFINGNLNVALAEEPVIASSRSPYSVEIRKGQLVTSTNLRDEKISAFSLSIDGSEIVIGTEHGSLKVFNINENSSVELSPKHYGKITYILHSKNNDSFFTCSVDTTINVWHKKTLQVSLSGHQTPVVMCAEFKINNKLLSWSEDGSLRVWNTDSGKHVYTIDESHKGNITCCDISSNDAFLAAAFANGSIMIWNAEDGSVQKDFPEQKLGSKVRCFKFSPATDLLIVGLNDGKILQCHLKGKGICHPRHSKHESAVSSIRMINEKDPVDKPLFLSASKSIKLWDRNVRCLQTILLPNSTLGDECTRIWTAENFEVCVVALNCIPYILRRIY